MSSLRYQIFCAVKHGCGDVDDMDFAERSVLMDIARKMAKDGIIRRVSKHCYVPVPGAVCPKEGAVKITGAARWEWAKTELERCWPERFLALVRP